MAIYHLSTKPISRGQGRSATKTIVAVSSLVLFGCTRTLTDSELLQKFQSHRVSYDRLRDLLVAGSGLRAVGSAGVQMADSPTYVMPPTPLVSSEKYREYADLLRSGEAIQASRSEGPNPDVCINVYADGWAGDTKHKNFCWREQPPASKGRFKATSIERNWYLEAD